MASQERSNSETRIAAMMVELYQKQLTGALDEVLARMTSTVENLKAELERSQSGSEYGKPAEDLVERFQHDVLWMVPNLGLDNLTRQATQLRTAKQVLAEAQSE